MGIALFAAVLWRLRAFWGIAVRSSMPSPFVPSRGSWPRHGSGAALQPTSCRVLRLSAIQGISWSFGWVG